MLDQRKMSQEREAEEGLVQDKGTHKPSAINPTDEDHDDPSREMAKLVSHDTSSNDTQPSALVSLLTILLTGAFVGLVSGLSFHFLPSTVPMDAPSDTFSGARAYKLLDDIQQLNDEAPHNWGSRESEKISKFLIEYVLDLQSRFGSAGNIDVEFLNFTSHVAFPYETRDFVELEEDPNNHRLWDDYSNVTWSSGDKYFSVFDAPCAVVGAYKERGCGLTNIAMFFNGSESTGANKAIQISAHHDSAMSSPGASDDGSGMVVVLELMRLFAQHPPKHDTLLVIYDAEEVGLIGSFVHNKLSKFKHIASTAINIEAGGTAIRDYVLKCNSEFMIDMYQNFAKHKLAYSVIGFIDSTAKLGGTDTGNLNKLGIHSVDLVFLEDRYRYHTAKDSIEFVKPEGLQRVGDNVFAIHQGMSQSPQDLPRRYKPGEAPSVGNLDNDYFAGEVFEATAPQSVYTTVYGSMWRFTFTAARVIFVIVAVLLSVLSILVSREPASSFITTSLRLLKNVGFVLILFLSSLVCGLVGYMVTGTTWKPKSAYFAPSEHTFRIAIVFLTVALVQVLVVFVWVKLQLGTLRCCSKSVKKAMTTDAPTVGKLSNMLYDAVHAFNILLLLLMAIAFVHLAQMFFWIPLWMYVGRLAKFVADKLGMGARVGVIARDVVCICLGVTLFMDVGSVFVTVFPYYFPTYLIFGGVVGFFSSLTILPFTPIVVRLFAGSDRKIGIGFVVFLALFWLVMQIVSAASIVAFEEYPERECTYATCKGIGRE